MKRVIIVGSARIKGRSASLAQQIFEACIEDCPQDEVALLSVAMLDIAGCVGCDACKRVLDKFADGITGGENTRESASENMHENTAESTNNNTSESTLISDISACAIKDDMQEVYEHLDSADELIVVSPIYFASAPSQLKALLDRLQPYYWTGARMQAKHPALLHVVGEGGDPHGFDPLIGTIRSALSVAGFSLDVVYDWVGKITAQGDITGEAQMYALQPEGEIEDADNANDSAQQ